MEPTKSKILITIFLNPDSAWKVLLLASTFNLNDFDDS